MTHLMRGDRVDCLLTPMAKFEKGRFLVATVIDVGKLSAKVTSKVIQQRSGRPYIRVPVRCCRIHKKHGDELRKKKFKQIEEAMGG